MSPRRIDSLLLASLAMLWLLAPGCGRKGSVFALLGNQRPVVQLDASPLGSPDTAWYAYDVRWTGRDSDGRVDRYQYAIDPPTAPGSDTLWTSTSATSRQVYFRATQVEYDPVHGWRANGFHVFALRAIDDGGAVSPVASRAFYAYTIAPSVRITLPQPSPLLSHPMPPSARIEWVGDDPDAVGPKRPRQYKYRLIGQADPDYAFARLDPDSLRRYHAGRHFAGWDSVSADTAWAEPLRAVTPGGQYVFVVVAIDEAGAYSPEFALDRNILQLTLSPPGSLGPILTVWGEGLYYQYPSGGSSLDPLAWINVDVPAGKPLTLHWSADTYAGVSLVGYRWRLDGDVGDETPRSDPESDWWHWSRRDTSARSCTIGPFAGGEEHFLYIEALDAWGLRSLAIVHFRTVSLTGEKDLLVVDDTRLAPDKFGANGVPQRYSGEWPAAAELDTFLYARGGFPWRGPHGVTGSLPPSRPGVFAGYSYDTLGTRTGFEVASAGVPLATLGRYRHVLWLTDWRAATSVSGSTSYVDPQSTLRWMCDDGRANTLAAYAAAGGEVWLAGGGAGYAATIARDRVGATDNNGLYGPGRVVFNGTAAELVPGRMMYDFAHWRSEFVTEVAATSVVRSPAAIGGWSHPGWRRAGTVVAPDYTGLPATLRRRSLALGDSLPPTRATQSNTYYYAGAVPVEYLTLANSIVEDIDPDPLVEHLTSTLDTLYELRGGQLATQFTGRTPATMTYYHGFECPRFLFTGFDLWSWTRQDVVSLVDFVLHDIWGLDRAAPVSRAGAVARGATGRAPALPAGPARPARPAPARAGARR